MIYQQIAGAYWWESLWAIIKKYYKIYEKCQCRDKRPILNTIHSTSTAIIFKKIIVNIIYIPGGSERKKYLVIKKENLIKWPEARILIVINSTNIVKFLWENFICQHRVFTKLINNRNPENKAWIIDLAKLYNIKHITTSAYNPRANKIIEVGHKPIINTLLKLTKGGYGNWVSLLLLVLWVERICMRVNMGKTLYKLLYDYMCVLPVEIYILIWSILS